MSITKPKFIALCQDIDLVQFNRDFLLSLKVRNFTTVAMPKLKKDDLNEHLKELQNYAIEIKLELVFGIGYEAEAEPVKKCFSKLFAKKFVPKTADEYYMPLIDDLLTKYFVTSFYHSDLDKLKYYVGSSMILHHISTSNINFYNEKAFQNHVCSPHNIWALQNKIFVNIIFDTKFKLPSINNLFNNNKGFNVYNIDYDLNGEIKEYVVISNFNHNAANNDVNYTSYKINASQHAIAGNQKQKQVYLTEFDDERKFVNQLNKDEKFVSKNRVIVGSHVVPAQTISVFVRD